MSRLFFLVSFNFWVLSCIICLGLSIVFKDIFFLEISGLIALIAILTHLEIKLIKKDPFLQ